MSEAGNDRKAEELAADSSETQKTTTPPPSASGTAQTGAPPAATAAVTVPPKAADAHNDNADESDHLLLGEESIIPCAYIPPSAVWVPLFYQTVVFVLYGLAAQFVETITLNFITARYPDPKTQDQLPDLGLQLLPRHLEFEHVTDLIIWILMILFAYAFFYAWQITKGKWETRCKRTLMNLGNRENIILMWTIRYAIVFGSAAIIRSFSMILTTLPATNNHCKTRPKIRDFWYNAVIGVATLGGGNIHCGDLLFSGHSMAVMMSVCSLWSYGPLAHKYLRPASIVLMVCSWFTILISRSHYSDDIFYAIWVTTTLWYLTSHSDKGAPPVAQMLIQNPLGVWSRAKKAEEELRAQHAAAVGTKSQEHQPRTV